MDLDDVLSDEEPQKPEAPVKPEAPGGDKPEGAPGDPTGDFEYKNLRKEHRKREYAARGRDPETGQFLPKEAVPEPAAPEPGKEAAPAAPPAPASPEAPAPAAPAPAQPEYTEREKALLKAALDERNKRQELERRLAQPAAPAQPTEPAKTFWNDPDAALTKHQQEIKQVQTNTVLRTAEMIARSKYADFDQEVAVFAEMVKTTPGLGQQWLDAADPAEFAYRVGKNNREIREAGGLAQYREKIERETRVKVEAELKAKAEEKLKETERLRRELPRTLSDVRGTSQNRVEWTGPTPLDDILK